MAGSPPQKRPAYTEMFDLNSLNPPQQEAVLHDKGPLLILAGAGSGKTRVITHRIAYLVEERGVSPYSILAITFTNKAAKEMRERAEKLLGSATSGMWVMTFHSMCVRILRRYAVHLGYTQDFTIYDTDDVKSQMRKIMKDLNINSKQFSPRVFISAISKAKNECISADEFAKTAYDYIDKQIARVYKEYQKRLQDNNAMDFDDLLLNTVILFDTVGEALNYYNDRFQYIMVDEYQDTNTAQFRLIKHLANHRNERGEYEHNLCVVGDDDQSIYKFRGADITNILSFENTFINAKVIKLEQNYRSTQKILDVANEVISHNYGRKDKKLWSAQDGGADVTFIQYGTDIEEATGVVREIQKKVDNGALYSDFAVLYRTNAQSRLFEERMIRMNMPYKLVGGVNFYQRREIKDILAYLKILVNPRDAAQIMRIANVPKRGIGDTTLDKLAEYADYTGCSLYEAMCSESGRASAPRAAKKIEEFVELIESFKEYKTENTIEELIGHIVAEIDYKDYIAAIDEDDDKTNDRMENISSLVDKAVDYEENAGADASLEDFLSEVSLVADIDMVDDDKDAVMLMTLHGAKGLEFPCVFICGMEENVFPSGMSQEPGEIEEERRLCYVGMTRAKKELTLTCAKQRMIHGMTTANNASRFIMKDVPRHMLHIAGHAHESFMHNYKSSLDPYKITRTSPYENPYTAYKKASASYSSESSAGDVPVRELSPAAPAGPGFEVGDMVNHPRYGAGKVTRIDKGSKDFEITVDFDGISRKMLASFAKLTKI